MGVARNSIVGGLMWYGYVSLHINDLKLLKKIPVDWGLGPYRPAMSMTYDSF